MINSKDQIINPERIASNLDKTLGAAIKQLENAIKELDAAMDCCNDEVVLVKGVNNFPGKINEVREKVITQKSNIIYVKDAIYKKALEVKNQEEIEYQKYLDAKEQEAAGGVSGV